MSLWQDKHRPKRLSKLDFHRRQAEHLERLVKTGSGDFPHLLVYGPPGAGKKTRVVALLREMYGAGAERLRIEHQNFETPSKKKLEIITVASNYHIEVNPSDVGIYDRIVIQELIKTVASAQQIHVQQPSDQSSSPSFKVVVLTEVDRLTKDAQHALRRTMEKYMSTCRIILMTNSTSKVIPAIRSRCLAVRVAAPTKEEVCSVLSSVAKKEGLNLPNELAGRIAEKANRNLRRAILMLQSCKVAQYPFSPDQAIVDLDWEVYLKQTAQHIVSEQSPKKLMEVRGRLYELLTHCIPPDVIFVGLLRELVKICDGELKTEVVAMAASYEHRLQKGNKAIYHLEAFVARFMSVYLRFVEETMGGF